MANPSIGGPPEEGQAGPQQSEAARAGLMNDLGEIRRLNLALEGNKKSVDLAVLDATKRAFKRGTAEWKKNRQDGPLIGAWKTLAEANDDPDDEPCESDMGYGQSHRVAAMRGHAGQQAQRPQENSATHTKNMIRRGIGAPLAQSSEIRPFSGGKAPAFPSGGLVPLRQPLPLNRNIQNLPVPAEQVAKRAAPESAPRGPAKKTNSGPAGPSSAKQSQVAQKAPAPAGRKKEVKPAKNAVHLPAALSFDDERPVVALPVAGVNAKKPSQAEANFVQDMKASQRMVAHQAPSSSSVVVSAAQVRALAQSVALTQARNPAQPVALTQAKTPAQPVALTQTRTPAQHVAPTQARTPAQPVAPTQPTTKASAPPTSAKNQSVTGMRWSKKLPKPAAHPRPLKEPSKIRGLVPPDEFMEATSFFGPRKAASSGAPSTSSKPPSSAASQSTEGPTQAGEKKVQFALPPRPTRLMGDLLDLDHRPARAESKHERDNSTNQMMRMFGIENEQDLLTFSAAAFPSPTKLRSDGERHGAQADAGPENGSLIDIADDGGGNEPLIWLLGDPNTPEPSVTTNEPGAYRSALDLLGIDNLEMTDYEMSALEARTAAWSLEEPVEQVRATDETKVDQPEPKASTPSEPGPAQSTRQTGLPASFRDLSSSRYATSPSDLQPTARPFEPPRGIKLAKAPAVTAFSSQASNASNDTMRDNKSESKSRMLSVFGGRPDDAAEHEAEPSKPSKKDSMPAAKGVGLWQSKHAP